jgi:hypothetical protein
LIDVHPTGDTFPDVVPPVARRRRRAVGVLSHVPVILVRAVIDGMLGFAKPLLDATVESLFPYQG